MRALGVGCRPGMAAACGTFCELRWPAAAGGLGMLREESAQAPSEMGGTWLSPG